MIRKRINLIIAGLFLFATGLSYSQGTDQAFQILDKAIGQKLEGENVQINFEGIAYGTPDPRKVFTLPAYKLYRGGFLIISGNKFEMQLGSIKTLSDGKLMVAIDEVSKSMFIDSVRNTSPGGEVSDEEYEKLLFEGIDDAKLTYEGLETINRRKCHRIRADQTGEEKTHVLYWVDVATGNLYLMAEWQNEAYDVYWVKSVTQAPAAHDFTVNFPKKEIESFYGYQVIDQRFINAELHPTKSTK